MESMDKNLEIVAAAMDSQVHRNGFSQSVGGGILVMPNFSSPATSSTLLPPE